MIFWKTDNSVCNTVSKAFENVRHISKFDDTPADCGIFYGLLRGSSRAMHILKHRGVDFYYIDNGYYGAEYVNGDMVKNTAAGHYRFCKSSTIHTYTGPRAETGVGPKNNRALLMMPSPYAANFHDTTPEDWAVKWAKVLESRGFIVEVKPKNDGRRFEEMAADYGIIVAFNSVGILRAVECGIPVYDSHGVLKNIDMLLDPSQDVRLMYRDNELWQFFTKRQFTLQQFANGEHLWLTREYI